KAFVVCGIPFSAIENPFFIDLLQNLCPSYEPPSRTVLASQLLNQVHSKIIIKREAVLRESKNLTMEYTFSSRLIKDCNEIIKYFKKSHQPNAYLQQAVNELKISGGGLKKFVDTRWTSAYECTLSVSQLERIELREQQFQTIAKTAITIWQQEGYDQYECANLVSYMQQFREKEDGFDLPYSFEKDTPLLCWMTNHVGSKSIGQFARKLFLIVSHSADCERTFSSL
ncbi:12242_t:CDS:2, partial [Racocetra persica]